VDQCESLIHYNECPYKLSKLGQREEGREENMKRHSQNIIYMPRNAWVHQKMRGETNRFSYVTLRCNQLCQHFDLGLLASSTVRQ
jgi:hypothetical protein